MHIIPSSFFSSSNNKSFPKSFVYCVDFYKNQIFFLVSQSFQLHKLFQFSLKTPAVSPYIRQCLQQVLPTITVYSVAIQNITWPMYVFFKLFWKKIRKKYLNYIDNWYQTYFPGVSTGCDTNLSKYKCLQLFFYCLDAYRFIFSQYSLFIIRGT